MSSTANPRRAHPNPGFNRPHFDQAPTSAPLGTTSRRVMFVVTHLGLGGAEVQVVDLSVRLKARGWDPMVVSLMNPTALTDRLQAHQIPVKTLSIRRERPTPRMVTGLARIFQEWRPDIVHSHTLPANFAARLARRLNRVPVLITSCHNVDEGGRGRMLFYRLTDGMADLTTNVSHAAVARYIEIGAAPAERIQYMPNGIDVQRFCPDPAARHRVRETLGVPAKSFLWLAVGRLEEQKDLPNMLRAFHRVASPDQLLLIVGEGPLRPSLTAQAARLGLERQVRFLGLRRDVPDLMRAADAYLMSSAWEGLPIVLLEAAATGLPAVVTDVGGNRQIVRPGETGFLAPSHDDQALSRAMSQLLALSREERLRLGAAARARVEASLSLDAITDRWETLYENLLVSTGSGAMTSHSG